MLSVPLLIEVVELAPVVKLEPNVQTPPDPLNTIGLAIDILLVVMVRPATVEVNVRIPDIDHVRLVAKVNDPAILSVGLDPPAKTIVPAEAVKSRQDTLPDTVTV